MKVYYAHCLAIYGRPQEARDVATLKALGFEVANPNSPECDAGYKAEGMPFFRKFAEECDAIAFRGLPGGRIPTGVATEIGYFTQKGKPVIELPSSVTQRALTVEQTREYLVEMGQR